MKNSYHDVAQILCYHVTMQILCQYENHVTTQIRCYYGNIMNMFQRKSLKLQRKKTACKKEEIMRLHSDLRRFFQSSFSEFYVNIFDKLQRMTFFSKTL